MHDPVRDDPFPARHPALRSLLARTSLATTGPLVCAVSGGADSVALALLARAASDDVTLVHVDHGLREGSVVEGERVAALADWLGARCVRHRVVVAPGADLEARARAARYAVLPEGTCTGHTQDDLAETVLWQILRGCGPEGLRPFGDLRYRRPLLGVRRAETLALCEALGWAPWSDPMNTDPRFTRVRIRHEVLPLLADVARRDPVPLIARLSELAGEQTDLLLALLGLPLEPPSVPSVAPRRVLPAVADARHLARLPRGHARFLVRRWLVEQRVLHHATPGRDASRPPPPTLADVDRVLDVARGAARATQVSGGHRVERHRGGLRFVPASPPARHEADHMTGKV